MSNMKLDPYVAAAYSEEGLRQRIKDTEYCIRSTRDAIADGRIPKDEAAIAAQRIYELEKTLEAEKWYLDRLLRTGSAF